MQLLYNGQKNLTEIHNSIEHSQEKLNLERVEWVEW